MRRNITPAAESFAIDAVFVNRPPVGGIQFLHIYIDSVRRGSISTSAKLRRV